MAEVDIYKPLCYLYIIRSLIQAGSTQCLLLFVILQETYQARLNKRKNRRKKMKFYVAPLEGITGYIYRNALEKYFPGADRYFTPFIVPDQKHPLRKKELRDILPGNNHVKDLVPQIMTNDADRFHEIVQVLQSYGYQEVNLNLGCPSGTVTARKKGAGFLAYPEELDRFLDQIFSENEVRISLKTRIGMKDPEEGFRLLEIYNQYPLSELIIHPRTREEFYKGEPHLDLYAQLAAVSHAPVCYNGNLLTARDYEAFHAAYPQTERVMLGRGVIRAPGLIGRLKNIDENVGRVYGRGACEKTQSDTAQSDTVQCDTVQEREREQQYLNRQQNEMDLPGTADRDLAAEKKLLREFHAEIFAQYREIFGEDRNAVFHMKELWSYMLQNFEHSEKIGKKIRKASKVTEYLCEVDRLFCECDLRADGPEARGLTMF